MFLLNEFFFSLLLFLDIFAIFLYWNFDHTFVLIFCFLEVCYIIVVEYCYYVR